MQQICPQRQHLAPTKTNIQSQNFTKTQSTNPNQ